MKQNIPKELFFRGKEPYRVQVGDYCAYPDRTTFAAYKVIKIHAKEADKPTKMWITTEHPDKYDASIFDSTDNRRYLLWYRKPKLTIIVRG